MENVTNNAAEAKRETAESQSEADAWRRIALDAQRAFWWAHRRANQLEGTIGCFLETTGGRVPADSSDSLSIEAVWVHRLRNAMAGDPRMGDTRPDYDVAVIALADVDSLLEGVAKQVGGMQLSVGENCVYSELVRSYKLDKGAKSLVQRASVAEANLNKLLAACRSIVAEDDRLTASGECITDMCDRIGALRTVLAEVATAEGK